MSLPEPSTSDTAPEMSVRGVHDALLYFQNKYGEARLRQLWARHQLGPSLEYMGTLTNFVSLDFMQRVLDLLVEESGDPELPRKSAMLTATPEALGFVLHILRAVGSPGRCYRKIVEILPTFNRVGRFELESFARDRLQLAYRSDRPERNRHLCDRRMAHLECIPQIWGLPAADVLEVECQLRGASWCRYQVSWQNPPVRAWLWAGILGGLALAVGSTVLGLGIPKVELATLAFFLVLAGTSADSWRELRIKDELLRTQNEGLILSLQDLELRYSEVFRANQALDSRVAERTAELADTNRRLQGALVKARELDRVKTEFFDNVSHELRTPLSLILLSLDSLQERGDAPSPGELRAHLDTLERSAFRLHRLIDQLLEIAKLEAGKTRLRYERVELHGLVSALVVPFRQLAHARQISLELEGAPVEPVHVDAEKIDAVFQNLLSNAVKFTPPGGQVKVRLRQLEDCVELEVEDSGMGISREDLPSIFDRFAQADARGIKRFGGTGIGLALVKETVELHGGTIAVRSEPGRGSCFTVWLPRGTAHVREELRERPQTEPSAPAAEAEVLASVLPRRESAPLPAAVEPSQAPLSAPRVLVVEDDPDLRRVIVGALRSRYRVTEAADGVEGEERALAEPPDLIVSDLMMPRRSGLQLLERLRAVPSQVDVPFILLTARRETDAVVEGLGTGASDYLGKPFVIRELLARVEVQLRLREAAQRAAAAERLSALGLLTSGFAHEVRNPLNGLLNAVEPLRSCLANPQAQRDATVLLDVIRDCGRRVQGLAESLLGFARPAQDAGEVDLAETLRSTVSVLRWRFTQELRLVMELPFRPVVSGDPSALNQVWLNLLDNALRAMGERGTVTVRLERAVGAVRVSVEDTGPGLPSPVREKLFEPFFSTRPAGEGTGLGLALCRRIVGEHGGRISVDSEPGRGAIFTVELPLLRELPQSEAVPAELAESLH